MTEHLIPGYTSLLTHFEATRDLANPHDGAWSLPNGDDYYAHRLKIYTTTDYSAEDIHRIGLEEVARIEARMRELLQGLGYGAEQPVGQLMNELNEDPKFLYADTPDRKDQVVADYNAMVAQATEGITGYFNRMPAVSKNKHPFSSYRNVSSSPGVVRNPLFSLASSPS